MSNYFFQCKAQDGGPLRYRALERIVLPIAQRRRSRHECSVVSTEGAIVFTGRPLIVLRFYQHQ